jgi:hypothetical protein
VWERRCDLSALRAVLVAAPALAPRVRRVVASFSECSPRARLDGVLVSVLGLQLFAGLKMIEIYAYGRFLSSQVDTRVRFVRALTGDGQWLAPQEADQALFLTNPTVSFPHGFAVGAQFIAGYYPVISREIPIWRPGLAGEEGQACARALAWTPLSASAGTQSSSPGNRASTSFLRSDTRRWTPSRRVLVTPASRRTFRWWVSVDLETGTSRAPQGSSQSDPSALTISSRTGSESAWSTPGRLN